MAFFDKLNDRIPVIRLCDLKILQKKDRLNMLDGLLISKNSLLY